MKEISIFLANNYIWFAIVDIFILFGLIGYLLDKKKKKEKQYETEILETIKFGNNEEIVEELNMQLGDKGEKSLNSVVNSINSSQVKEEDTETLI